MEVVTATFTSETVFYINQVRSSSGAGQKLVGHKQEVCGLKWNSENTHLASGGNDNQLFVWDKRSSVVQHQFSEHKAAVKALAWSPHQNGLLCSGGGTADRCIKFYNTQLGKLISSVDTKSQVCNLAWSRTSDELVSTHGYSQNQIQVWSVNSMQLQQTLTGHAMRVLYLCMSPCGQQIATGAGDETLRFWNVFPKKSAKGPERATVR